MKKQLLFCFKDNLFREISLRMTAFAVLTLLTVQFSFAQSVTWTGGTGGTNSDFLTGTNWSSTPLFNNTSNFTIVSGPSSQPVLSSNYPTSSSGTVAVNIGATLTTNANITTSTSTNNIDGTINVNAGSSYTSRIYMGTVAGGNGVINVATGGTLNTATGVWRLGNYNTIAGQEGVGTININGGTFNIGTGTSSGTFSLGHLSGAKGILNINTGIVNVNYTNFGTQFVIPFNGVVNIDNGSLIISGDQTVAVQGFISSDKIKVSGAALTAGKVLSNTYDSGTNKTTVSTVSPPSTTWDGSVWSNGNPSSSVHAIIDGTYSTTANGAFTALVLTVNAGKSLTIKTGTNVTVQNQVINNGNLVVENNANLIQVNSTTNIGNITVNRNSNALSRLDYTLWSSPVASQNLAVFSPLTSQSPSRFYTYTPGTPDAYTAVASPTTTNFTAGHGYLIRMPNTAVAYPATETFTGTFTGVPNNGNVSRTGLTAGKFYAVGNPYPSVVSATLLLSGNPNVVQTLYFWRKTNGIANSGSSYSTWTTAGGVAGGNAANNIVPNGSIQVGQGFIVNTGTATSLNFTNAMRETTPSSTQFLKIAKETEKSRIWLNLTSEGLFSQALVAYMDGATEGVDNGIDGKYINDSKVALTSNIDGEEYVIQGRPSFDASDVVALNFKTDKAGEYKIAIDHTDGLFAKGQNVYLVDSVTGTETNLTTDAYTFTAESGTANDRFTLKYESSSKVVGSAVFNENTVTVYKNNGVLYVNSSGNAIVNIKVFNVQGRLIAEQKGVNATAAAIKNLKATQQVVLVQVTSEDGKVVTKKVVN